MQELTDQFSKLLDEANDGDEFKLIIDSLKASKESLVRSKEIESVFQVVIDQSNQILGAAIKIT